MWLCVCMCVCMHACSQGERCISATSTATKPFLRCWERTKSCGVSHWSLHACTTHTSHALPVNSHLTYSAWHHYLCLPYVHLTTCAIFRRRHVRHLAVAGVNADCNWNRVCSTYTGEVSYLWVRQSQDYRIPRLTVPLYHLLFVWVCLCTFNNMRVYFLWFNNF